MELLVLDVVDIPDIVPNVFVPDVDDIPPDPKVASPVTPRVDENVADVPVITPIVEAPNVDDPDVLVNPPDPITVDVKFEVPDTEREPSVPTAVICVCEALTLKVFPVFVIPVPAIILPAPENCVNTNASVPTISALVSLVHTQPESLFTVPFSMKINAPAADEVVEKSDARDGEPDTFTL
jgi:hypothetical protein